MNLLDYKKLFMEKVAFLADCWIWDGYKRTTGYGIFSVKGKRFGAHRASYIIHKGEIPPGINVCHTCDNPSCVNPDHLWLGTTLENHQDMMRKGRYVNHQRSKTHCKQGHPFSPENTYYPRRGGRACKTCQINRSLASAAKTRAKNKTSI